MIRRDYIVYFHDASKMLYEEETPDLNEMTQVVVSAYTKEDVKRIVNDRFPEKDIFNIEVK